MKKLLIIFAFLITGVAIGQISKVKAVEHKGVTTAVRDGLNTTGVFPVIYNITTGQFERWNGVAWEAWGAGGGTGTDDQTATEVPVSPAVNSNTDVQSVLEDHETRIDGLAAGGADGVVTNIELSGTTLVVDGTGGGEDVDVDLSSLQDGTGTDDQTGSEVSLTPSGDIASTDVQAGIVELDSEKVAIDPLSPFQDITLAIGTTAAMDAAYGVDPTIPNGHIYYYTDSETTAVDIGYDNTTSGLTATNVKAAIDEVAAAGGGGTDDQNISGSGLAGTNLTIGIENGANEVVDLSPLQDGTGTDDQTASEVNVTDAGGNYTAGDVEGILAEIAPQLGGGGTFSGTIEDNQIAIGSATDAIEGTNNFTYDPTLNRFRMSSATNTGPDFEQKWVFSSNTHTIRLDGLNSTGYLHFDNGAGGASMDLIFNADAIRPGLASTFDLGTITFPFEDVYSDEFITSTGSSVDWDATREDWQESVAALGNLTSLSEGALVNGEIRYVQNDGSGESLYVWNSTATSGGVFPNTSDGTGQWIKLNSGGSSGPFNDNETVVQDNLDNTKELQFNLDAIGTGVTRTITMIDENVDLSALGASNIGPDAVSDSEIDYTNVTLADFTNDANLVASVGAGRTGVIPITETYAQSQEDFDLDGPPPANHHVVITNAQVTSAEIEDATIVNADIADNTIEADKLEATNTPTDGQVATFDTASGGVTWETQSGAGGGLLERVTLTITDPDFTGGSTVINELIPAQGVGTVIQVVSIAVRTEDYTSTSTNTTWNIVYNGDGGTLTSGIAALPGTTNNTTSGDSPGYDRYADYSNTAVDFRLTHSTSETTTGDIKINVLYYVWTY